MENFFCGTTRRNHGDFTAIRKRGPRNREKSATGKAPEIPLLDRRLLAGIDSSIALGRSVAVPWSRPMARRVVQCETSFDRLNSRPTNRVSFPVSRHLNSRAMGLAGARRHALQAAWIGDLWAAKAAIKGWRGTPPWHAGDAHQERLAGRLRRRPLRPRTAWSSAGNWPPFRPSGARCRCWRSACCPGDETPPCAPRCR